MNYLSSYRKGFTDKTTWMRFANGVAAGDCHAMATAVEQSGATRLPVDCYITALRTRDISILNNGLRNIGPEADVGSAEFDAEQQEIHDLVELRDVPLHELPSSMTQGLREISMFLQGMLVPIRDTTDFMRTEAQWVWIQAGNAPRERVSEGEASTIVTGRDLATYVHNDFPTDPWLDVVRYLMDAGVAQRLPAQLHDSDGDGQARFACYGLPYIAGLIGETCRRSGVLSFQNKWNKLVPRPEEYAMMAGYGLLPQCYPEGSPMHPSQGAMHSMAALACAALIKALFNEAHILESGRTVGEEIDLLADNIGYGRLWAGVHRRADHTSIMKVASLMGQQVAKEHL